MKTFNKYSLCLVCVTIFVFYGFTVIIGKENSISLSPKCGQYPKTTDILNDNFMWQVLRNPNGNLFLMNAYLDLRWNKTVVINAIGAALNLTVKNIFCQYWFENRNEPIVVQAFRFQNLWRKRKF